MIDYRQGAFNINLIGRFYGSALSRSMVPGVLSLIFYILINPVANELTLLHPSPVIVLVGNISLLIVFRANHAYRRYWDACAAVFEMMSWFMDTTVHMATFHMQSEHYADIKPPSYYDHFHLNDYFLTREREHYANASKIPLNIQQARSVQKSINFVHDEDKRRDSKSKWESYSEEFLNTASQAYTAEPGKLSGRPRLDGGWAGLFCDPETERSASSTYHMHGIEWSDEKGFASTAGGRTAPLFLQELAHLASLLNAVALSTLRNDIEGAQSPLGMYLAGSNWPPVDPGGLKTGSLWARICHVLGADRTAESLTDYNASRPLPVIGGVSDAEILFLQAARGPQAKVQLAHSWLAEFITRESLSGSVGKCGQPLLSRNYNFLGSAMEQYNVARTIMSIPFPYVHAQLSVFFILTILPSVPYLMTQYLNEMWIGGLLCFLTVSCLVGMHEVARELESPFRNVPNELPLVTLQAQFNECLYVMYSGYHPDAFWDTSTGPANKPGQGVKGRTSLRSSVDSASIISTSIKEEEADALSMSGNSDKDDPSERTQVGASDMDMDMNDDVEDIENKLKEHAKAVKKLKRRLKRQMAKQERDKATVSRHSLFQYPSVP